MLKEAEENLDITLLNKIQPQGGISFRDESYVKTGTGYECCIHVYTYPSEATQNWLFTISNINDTVVTIDIGTDDIYEVKKNINRSLKEQNTRYKSANNFEDRYDAEQRATEMKTLYHELTKMGEVMKLITVRIFVADRSLVKLEEKIKKLLKLLESNNYRAAIFLNETKNEWTSMYRTYTQQQKDLFAVVGQPMTAHALAIGNPFHFSSLEDPTGSYMGYTPCGGNVILDEFTKTKTRLYYNAVAIGTMGAGKSTLLKKRFTDRAARGDFVRTFDATGEFKTITKTYGGRYINLDGSQGMLNPLEILRSGDNETINFQRHISKVTTIYKYLKPTVKDEELTTYTNITRNFYEKYGLNPELGNEEIQITGLPSKSYPRFSDQLQYVEEEMKRIADGNYNEVELAVAKNNLIIYDNIRKVLVKIVETYGSIFNGYTTFDNILDEQIVTFDISTLKNLEDNIFDAQIFNMISLCWDNCVTNGQIMYKLLNEGKIKLWDVVKFQILIDESHRWINAQKLQAIDLITVYLREARKFFGGILLASQSIRDYVPEGSSDLAINKLKTIFELTQYKYIFHQDSNVLGLIDVVFQNVLTKAQREKIPYLEQGDNILCIAGTKNLEFHVAMSKEEDKLFTGGL